MRKQKSIPFYIICFCLGLIVLSSLFAVLWQPGFAHGVISIKIMDSYVGYNLWGFLIEVLLLLAFIFLFIRLLRSTKRNTPSLIIALLMGGAFSILLDHITYGWTFYPPAGSLGKTQLTPEKYKMVLQLIKVSVGIAILILLYRWVKMKWYTSL